MTAESQPPSARTIQIVERDGDVVLMLGRSPRGEIEVIASMVLEGTTLVLRGLHIAGASPGSIGRSELLQFARQLGHHQGARRVVVLGAVRTSGARPGHVPRAISIEVD